LFLEQFAHEFYGRGLVAPSLHEQLENLGFVVDRSPQPELPALSSRPSPRDATAPLAVESTAKFSGEQRREL
jgi:hypothetical protein